MRIDDPATQRNRPARIAERDREPALAIIIANAGSALSFRRRTAGYAHAPAGRLRVRRGRGDRARSQPGRGPERPRDDAFQSPDPRYPAARVLERQRPGYEVYLLESRVVDGREWWRIADSAHVGCCAPFGWIPALRADGSQVFRIADVICPAPVGPLTSYDLYRIDGFDPPVCHGDRDVTLRGYLACLRWNIDASYFLNGLRSWDETGYECKLDDRLTVYGEVVPSSSSGTSANEWRDVVDVTGHYFAEESDSCRWVTGNFMQMPVDGAPIDTAQFACRMRFYATSVARLP